MKKRFWCLGMAVFMLCGSVIYVHAEDYTGEAGWEVEFTGNGMESNFNSSALSDAVYALQPGDSVTLSLALKNSDSQAADWYMTNEILSSLEESQSVANGGAYTYHLTYTDSAGAENILYSSENVGGEKNTEAGVGLHEVSDNMDEFFYLDRLVPGGSGRIVLKVVLDGETQGNTYQNTLAALQMNFAVEKAAKDSGGGSGGGNGNSGGSVTVPRKIVKISETGTSDKIYLLKDVKTGDTSHTVLWSLLALVSGAGLFVMMILYMRKEKGGSDSE